MCTENAAMQVAFSRNTDQNEGFEEHGSKITNGAPIKFVDVFLKVRPAVTSTFALFVEKVHFLHLVRWQSSHPHFHNFESMPSKYMQTTFFGDKNHFFDQKNIHSCYIFTPKIADFPPVSPKGPNRCISYNTSLVTYIWNYNTSLSSYSTNQCTSYNTSLISFVNTSIITQNNAYNLSHVNLVNN